ncbi:carboxyl-terminal protease [Clostridium fallax]|uniref:C-terminal processing peptidase-3. Serine peptidase. MEROPS family S41A n=2 Tax=Clostridium fallax TaxID=1533 RepID=A0A1M4VLI1_9CLOT|nr:S41 family peptidase [Clostridium fallax]SHE69946.1 C-terminal processing peptidase-3. Serine peptidase. MEROPS family S41A [Clostridium fallax]SQB22787.1 carboxyl-terminal protease [Clostridium fallax]
MGMEQKEGSAKNFNKKIIITLSIVLLFFVTAFGSFYFGSKFAFSKYSPALNDKEIAKSLSGVKDISKFKELFTIRDILYKYYDGEINENALVEGAIKGMTESLKDPYTVYMNPDEYENFKEKSEGSYNGLGIQLGVKDDKIIIVSPLKNSPAEKAGIKKGDIILKVNDTSVGANDLEKAISMMKGKEQADIKLTLNREDKGNFDVMLKREVIKTESVKSELINNNIGYIQIIGFEQETGKDFKNQLQQLKDKGAKGLILDLRDNPGGYLTESVDVVSNFIPKDKTIVSTIDKYKNETKNESKGGIAIGMPLVVLTNNRSASASEIVSGAIRDYKVGTLVGETTYGKGVVQVLLPNKESGSALKVTISKYYTPNGENINKIGIKPDIEISYPEELKSKPYDRNTDPQFEKALEVINEKLK